MELNLRLLHLPVDATDVTRERKPSPASRVTARRRSRPERPHESARILIVDDEPAVAEPVRDYLLSRGHTVDLAFSTDDALTAIRQIRRDLVLLDSSMPQIDGVEALRRIRAEDASLAVIMLGGPIDFADLDRAATAALTSLLTAPDCTTQTRLSGSISRTWLIRDRSRMTQPLTDVDTSLCHAPRREPRAKRLDSRSAGLA